MLDALAGTQSASAPVVKG